MLDGPDRKKQQGIPDRPLARLPPIAATLLLLPVPVKMLMAVRRPYLFAQGMMLLHQLL